MACRELIASREILEAAFAITRQKGFLEVTARSVASKAGCSTQPVFRAYRNMEELRNAVYNRAVSFFQDYCSLYPKTGKTPFSNLGMAYIAFAREESCLFEFLFVSGKPKSSFYELLTVQPSAEIWPLKSALPESAAALSRRRYFSECGF